MLHQAIYNTHPAVKSICDDKPLDANGNSVVIDQSVVDTEVIKLQAAHDGLAYSRTRANEYLPIGDQMDMQYKDLINGTTTWKDHIAKVKSDNPKG